jgi:hypothetical protein
VDCGVNSCSAGEDGRYVFHSKGCIDSSGIAKCYDRTPDPDLKPEYCHTCFPIQNGIDHWFGHKCCGDDPGEDFSYASTSGSCCYNADVIQNSVVVTADHRTNSLLCLDGIIYVCGSVLSDCAQATCIGKTNCSREGSWTCCEGQWKKSCVSCN